MLKKFFFKLIHFNRLVTLHFFMLLVFVTLKFASRKGFSAKSIDARRAHDAKDAKMKRDFEIRFSVFVIQ